SQQKETSSASGNNSQSGNAVAENRSPDNSLASPANVQHDPIADAERALRFKSRFESNLIAATQNTSVNGDPGVPSAQPSLSSNGTQPHTGTNWLPAGTNASAQDE